MRKNIYDDTVPQLLGRSYGAPDFHAGCAEPWIAELVATLVRASGTVNAIEIGAFEGFTSERMARALALQPWSTTLTVCEIDPERAYAVQTRLDALALPTVQIRVTADDSLRWLPSLGDETVDFAWIDGNHELAHVDRETALLMPKLRVGGIAAYHDVWGVCDLQQVVHRWGGYALQLPMLGPAGGLGMIQRRA